MLAGFCLSSEAKLFLATESSSNALYCCCTFKHKVLAMSYIVAALLSLQFIAKP